MVSFKILIDSTTDLPKELSLPFVPIHVFAGVVEMQDKIEFTADKLRELAGKGVPVRTSAPSPMEFVRAVMDMGKERPILIPTLTSKLSGTYNAAATAARILAKKGYDVRVFDTLSGSIGAGLLVKKAAEMAGNGVPIDNALEKLKELRDRLSLHLFIADMHAAARSGRVPDVIGRIGKFLKIHPSFYVQEGRIRLWKVFRGEKNMFNAIVELVSGRRELWVGVLGEHPVFSRLIDALREKGVNPVVTQVDPAIGVHLGYGSFGFAFFR